MKTKIAVALSTALILGASAARAESFVDNVYVLGAVGESYSTIDQSGSDRSLASVGATGLSSSIKNHDTAYKLQAGYRFMDYLAVEAGYFNLGKFNYHATFNQGSADQSWKVDGWNVSVLGIYPFAQSFSVFGKLGLAQSSTKLTGSVSAPGLAYTPGSDNTTGVVYGAGLGYNITKAVGVRVEYESYDQVGGANVGGKTNIEVLSAGLSYRF